jgi:hypothetical protein
MLGALTRMMAILLILFGFFVYITQLVAAAVADGDADVRADACRIGQYAAGEAVAPNAQELAGRLFTTTYMGTVNSSRETRDRWVIITTICASPCEAGGINPSISSSSINHYYHHHHHC